MPRSFQDVRRWQREGTERFLDAVSALDAAALEQDSGLAGWTRKHLLAHVAANSEALQNLVHWAATGERTLMYASPEARQAGVEKGSMLGATELVAWVRSSAAGLDAVMSELDDEQWQAKVVTGQGRTVAATEVPWLRCREVFVHTVDLDVGVTFADLPSDFLAALREDILLSRTFANKNASDLEGSLADVTGYLAGRRFSNVTTADGEPAPELGPWL
jgi:maleylpyruvate isomerase